MITIVIGFVLLIVAGLIVGWGGVVAVIAVTTAIILLPVEGFEERECTNEVPLIRLKRSTSKEKVYYLEKHRGKVIFAFDNCDAYDINFEAYEEDTIRGNIKIYESEQCKSPVVRVFKSEPVHTQIWTFAPFQRIEYVFLIPKGTLLYKKDKDKEQETIVV